MSQIHGNGVKAGDLVERLRQLDSCTVSDAMDMVGLEGVVPGIRRLATDRRIAGRVLTVTLGIAPLPFSPSCTCAIDRAEPGDVIVVEQRTGTLAASWSGILSHAARERGIAGVIVEGLARDIDEAGEIDFPVFARDPTCRRARRLVHELASGLPALCGNVAVCEGDFVIADGSGVVFVPAAELAGVVEAAERIAARNRLMIDAVHRGEPLVVETGSNDETSSGFQAGMG